MWSIPPRLSHVKCETNSRLETRSGEKNNFRLRIVSTTWECLQKHQVSPNKTLQLKIKNKKRWCNTKIPAFLSSKIHLSKIYQQTTGSRIFIFRGHFTSPDWPPFWSENRMLEGTNLIKDPGIKDTSLPEELRTFCKLGVRWTKRGAGCAPESLVKEDDVICNRCIYIYTWNDMYLYQIKYLYKYIWYLNWYNT